MSLVQRKRKNIAWNTTASFSFFKFDQYANNQGESVHIRFFLKDAFFFFFYQTNTEIIPLNNHNILLYINFLFGV